MRAEPSFPYAVVPSHHTYGVSRRAPRVYGSKGVVEDGIRRYWLTCPVVPGSDGPAQSHRPAGFLHGR